MSSAPSPIEGPDRPNHVRTLGAHLASGLLGVAVGVAVWVLIVPWDLSTHRGGRPIPGGRTESEHVALLAVAGVLPYLVAIAGGVTHRFRPLAFSFGSGAAWIVLTTWRGLAAEVHGANMAGLWPVVGAPLALIGSVAVVSITALVEAVRRRWT